MERHKQITQDIGKTGGEVVFLPDGRVATLKNQSEVVFVARPSRVEGVSRQVPAKKNTLELEKVYDNFQDLIGAARDRVNPMAYYSDNGWRAEHIPAEVFARCEAWVDSVEAPSIDKIVNSERLKQAYDYDEVQPCPHCPPDVKYACYTSGWTRELYRYPMVKVESESGEKYEVPFDVALYAATVPGGVDYETEHVINQGNGHLSAKRTVGVRKNYLTREYIQRVTGGESAPEGDIFYCENSIYMPTDSEIVLDTWREDEKSLNMPYKTQVLDAEQIIDKLQDDIMIGCVEKADGIDHNARFDRVCKALGERGLGVMFYTKNEGMGNVSFAGGEYDPVKRIQTKSYLAIDFAEVVDKMHEKIVAHNQQDNA